MMKSGMDGPTIFHLDFVKVLEEVSEHFHLQPLVYSITVLPEEGRKGAVHMQTIPNDACSFSTFYGYGEDDFEAKCSAAREALKSLYFTLNFGVVDLHTYEYWESLIKLAQTEQQHQEEIAQL
jgi:hypothetical protein